MKEASDIGAGIVLNERTTGLTLPDLKGKWDFNCGFGGNEKLFYKWCFDLFDYYWSNTNRKILL
jgi:predicted transcriptional regulator